MWILNVISSNRDHWPDLFAICLFYEDVDFRLKKNVRIISEMNNPFKGFVIVLTERVIMIHQPLIRFGGSLIGEEDEDF